jgi:outer membrane protein assembly factor BamB
VFICGYLLSGWARAENWPQWRGPTGDGVSAETGLPLKWSEHSNVAWKCPLPGHGASTPVIWNDAVFLTSQQEETLLLLRIEKATGKIIWTRQVGSGEVRRIPPRGKSGDERRQQKFHELHNMASPSPVTDGERVVVHFGNGDLAAYDFEGHRLWQTNLQKDHGTYTIWWGHANSPVLYKNLVIAVSMQDSLADLQDEPVASYVAAYDKQTGEQKWKSLRVTKAKAEECDSYTTPLLRQVQGKTELVIAGADDIDAYDPATGQRLWFLNGLAKGRTITGPTLGHGLVYATQGMRGALVAVRPTTAGKLPPEAVVWKETKGTPDSSSPVIWKDLIFWISDNGIAQCRDALTGALKWEKRFSGDFKASPLAAEGRIYFLNLKGVCTVVAASAQFEKLAENRIDDETIASPAVSDGRILLRGRRRLYCLGTP